MKFYTMNNVISTALILLFFAGSANSQELDYQPPWNNPPESSVNLTIAGLENVPDLYGDITDPQLVIFFAGNQFMVMEELIDAFKKEHPEYKRIFVETLPPGKLADQIKGGSLTIGNLRITHQPDVYTAGKGRIEEMKDYLTEPKLYAKNKLTLMVREGNPKGIQGLNDLDKPDLRISMPNPKWEGIGQQIIKAYEKVGGAKLRDAVMKDKVDDGTTYLTKIHHRQSPLRILNDLSDVAPVWHTEVAFQEMKGHPVDQVAIPDNQNIIAQYYAGRLKKAPHRKAAKDFLDFLTSEKGKAIYRKYGFITDF